MASVPLDKLSSSGKENDAKGKEDPAGVMEQPLQLPEASPASFQPHKKVKRLRGKKKEHNIVVSIFNNDILTRVILTKYQPYLCVHCGQTFTHTSPLKEHAEQHHGYTEPEEMTFDGKGHQITMTRSSKPKKKSAPIKESSSNIQKETTEAALEGAEEVSNHGEEFSSIDYSQDDIIQDPDSRVSSQTNDSGSTNPEFLVSMFGLIPVTRSISDTSIKKTKKESPSNRVDDESSKNSERDSSFVEHRDQAQRQKKNKFRCVMCGLLSTTSAQRKKHMEEVHRVFQRKIDADMYKRKMETMEESRETGGGDQENEDTLTCPHCKFFFHDASDLEKHMQSHCGIASIKCDVCKEGIRLWDEGKIKELGGLMTKYEEQSGKQRRKEAEEGTKETVDFASGLAECIGRENRNDAVVEEIISEGKETKAQEILRRSLEKANGPSGLTHCITNCLECDEKFYLRLHLQNHYKIHKEFNCKRCDKQFTTVSAIGNHYAKEHKVGCYKCFFCSKRFYEGGKNTYHMLGHLGAFQCIICGFTVMSKQSLEEHIERYVDEPSHTQCSDDERIQYSTTNPFMTRKGRKKMHICKKNYIPCQFCNMTFSSERFLWRHEVNRHPEEQMPSGIEGKYCCDRCGHLFATQKSLTAHQETHRTRNRNLPCPKPECNAMFRSKACLFQHSRGHSNNSYHYCEICNKRFKTKAILTSHMRWHEGGNPFQCRFCAKNFRYTTGLRYHEKQMHLGEKDHVCHHCGKRYACPSTLKVHLKTHSKDKPYKCEYCDMAFPTELYLRAHRRIHTKPFKCEQCGEGFAQKGARRTHLLKVHGIQEELTRSYTGKSWSATNPEASTANPDKVEEEIQDSGSVQQRVLVIDQADGATIAVHDYPDGMTNIAIDTILSQMDV